MRVLPNAKPPTLKRRLPSSFLLAVFMCGENQKPAIASGMIRKNNIILLFFWGILHWRFLLLRAAHLSMLLHIAAFALFHWLPHIGATIGIANSTGLVRNSVASAFANVM